MCGRPRRAERLDLRAPDADRHGSHHRSRWASHVCQCQLHGVTGGQPTSACAANGQTSRPSPIAGHKQAIRVPPRSAATVAGSYLLATKAPALPVLPGRGRCGCWLPAVRARPGPGSGVPPGSCGRSRARRRPRRSIGSRFSRRKGFQPLSAAVLCTSTTRRRAMRHIRSRSGSTLPGLRDPRLQEHRRQRWRGGRGNDPAATPQRRRPPG